MSVTTQVADTIAPAEVRLEDSYAVGEDTKEACFMDRVDAVERLHKSLKGWRLRSNLKAAGKKWRAAELERRNMLERGVPGAIGLALGNPKHPLMVKAVGKGTPAEAAGIIAGDLVVSVIRNGRGGTRVTCPTPNKGSFLAAIGTPGGMFEGCIATIVYLREPNAVKGWTTHDDSEIDKLLKTHGEKSAVFKEAWQNKVDKFNNSSGDLTLGTSTAAATRTLQKAVKTVFDKSGGDFDLAMAYLTDPVKCKTLTKEIFDSCDDDKSGTLSEDEITGVSKAICAKLKLPEPDEKTHKVLFYRMDISADGHVDFDEFFAYYRAHVINMLAFGCGLVE
eukprot:TRINITY_DN1201_c0_g1_i1.p1 TRINITY_DN1201_c0_g1~~TRINITY_DN1201_c0_g1_i1.p1  ORF type:complete len:335 (+),score=89.83 TRINITY_DN1201_c0_g1_i1:95-1099(+)